MRVSRARQSGRGYGQEARRGHETIDRLLTLMKLYDELAEWWPLFSAPADYAEEAEFFAKVLNASCDTAARTVLELGAGGGNNAFHLKRSFEMTLVDASSRMLQVSRALNPGCEHREGDMRTLDLERTF